MIQCLYFYILHLHFTFKYFLSSACYMNCFNTVDSNSYSLLLYLLMYQLYFYIALYIALRTQPLLPPTAVAPVVKG